MKPGSRFGQYEIRRELGRGATDVVVEAFDRATQRRVALKMPRDAVDAARVRYQRAREVAAALLHPAIVAVYDGSDDPPGLVMELVDGLDLKARLAARERFGPVRIAQVMGQLLGALHHAHQRGVVHGDVRPAHVLLRENGRLKLTAFGFVPASDIGADLRASGAILHELVTGRTPGSPEPPQRAMPAALGEIVRKALSTTPGEAFADAPEFEHALAGALFLEELGGGEDADEDDVDEPGTVAPPPAAAPTGRPTFLLPAIVGVAALVAIGAGLSAPRFDAMDTEDRRVAIAPSLTAAPAPIAAAEAPRTDGSGPAVAARTPQEIERLAWDHARAADNATAYRAYVSAYPDGAYLHLAQVHLASLARARLPDERDAQP